MSSHQATAHRRGLSEETPRGPRREYRARARRRRRIIISIVVVVLLVVGGVVATVLTRAHHYDQNMARVNAFKGTGHGAAADLDGAQNFLIIGSDTRSGSLPSDQKAKKIAETGGQRSDVLILAHLTADHSKAYLISIPRDSYVSIPAGGNWDGGRNKINSAFAFGGAPLAVQTVELFTGVTIDHVVMVNFAGFKKMTDALGGVNVTVDQTVTDPRSHRTFHQGVNHLNGAAALDYVRQRYGLPHGDFDREHRQQQFIHALMAKAGSSGTLTNPGKLDNFLDAATKSVLVDDGFSLSDAVFALRDLRPSDLTFITTPHTNDYPRIPGVGSVVKIDREPALTLFQAVESDQVGQWLKEHPDYRNDATSGS